MRNAAIGLFAVSLLVAIDGAAEAGEVDQSRLMAARRCEVAQRLEAIHRHAIDESKPDGGNGRYLVIAIRGKPHSYVQCMYHDRDASLYCEVASGRFAPADKAADFPLAPEKIAALRALGYNVETTEGNYGVDRPATSVGELADRILKALQIAFDAEPATELDFVAPLATDLTPSCKPTG